jgi:hypothetical protein
MRKKNPLYSPYPKTPQKCPIPKPKKKSCPEKHHPSKKSKRQTTNANAANNNKNNHQNRAPRPPAARKEYRKKPIPQVIESERKKKSSPRLHAHKVQLPPSFKTNFPSLKPRQCDQSPQKGGGVRQRELEKKAIQTGPHEKHVSSSQTAAAFSPKGSAASGSWNPVFFYVGDRSLLGVFFSEFLFFFIIIILGERERRAYLVMVVVVVVVVHHVEKRDNAEKRHAARGIIM